MTVDFAAIGIPSLPDGLIVDVKWQDVAEFFIARLPE